MGKILEQLVKRYNTKDFKWIEDNVTAIENTSLSIFENADYPVEEFFNMYDGRPDVEVDLFRGLQIRNNMTVSQFADAVKGRINDNVLSEFVKFTNNKSLNFEGKSVLSAIWSNIIYNSISQNEENTDYLWDMFFSVIKSDRTIDRDLSLSEIYDEVYETYKNHENFALVEEFFAQTFNELQQDIETWFDYTDPLAPEIIDEEENEIEIKNDEELIKALGDYKNYPSLIEYIKDVYLSETNVKKDGYCNNEFVATYKATAIVLKLIKDNKLNTADFDKDNNIGYNLSRKYDLCQKMFNTLKYSSTSQANMLVQASKIANIISGKNSTNEYEVWKKVVEGYVRRCDRISMKIKKGVALTATDRRYLTGMQLTKFKQPIKSQDELFLALRLKRDDAERLANYLDARKVKSHGIEAIKDDIYLEKAEEIYNELATWRNGIKDIQAIPCKMANLDTENLPNGTIKIYAKVAKREYSKTEKKDTADGNTQMSIEDYMDHQ